MQHRSVGSPVNRKVIVSRFPITKQIVCKLLRTEMDDAEDESGESNMASVAFLNPIASGKMLSSADSDAGKFVHVSAFEQDPPPIFEGPQTTEASLSADFSAATSEIPVHVRQ